MYNKKERILKVEYPAITEKELQKQVEEYLKIKGIPFVHIINRCFKCGQIFKHNVGYPDIILVAGGIELKTKKGRQSKVQKEIERFFKRKGIPYKVCRSLEEVIEFLGGEK